MRSSSSTAAMMFLSIVATIISLSTSFASAASTTTSSSSFLQHRNLDFNTYWNGEWKADSSGNKNYACTDCDDDGASSGSNSGARSDMWYDDNVQSFQTQQYVIIRNASLGLLALLILSCCMCYPEILILAWNKITCCCPSKEEIDENVDGGGGDYVGGKMSSGTNLKKKRSKKKEQASGLAPNSDVELV
jgi:hypothetical protein